MIIGGPALTKYNDRALRNLTTAPASATSSPGALVHIKTLTASSSGTLSFVHGSSSVILDSTYKEYLFILKDIHGSINDRRLEFNKTLPSLNLTCTYCNKPFILPGMKENGHKQKPVKHCSYLCLKREERLRKLWIPKWLYNFYVDKKLYRILSQDITINYGHKEEKNRTTKSF